MVSSTPKLTTADTTITAQYVDDGNYLESPVSAGSAVTVTQASTTTKVTITPSPSALGSPVNLTAVVTVNTPGSGVPTGNVIFSNGTTQLGTQPLDATLGTATFTTSSLPLGATSITATYQGDHNLPPGASRPRRRRYRDRPQRVQHGGHRVTRLDRLRPVGNADGDSHPR